MSHKSPEKETIMVAESASTVSHSELISKCYSLNESKKLLLKRVKSLINLKSILLLLITSIVTQSVAQITTLEKPVQDDKSIKNTQNEVLVVYDSLKNFDVYTNSKSSKNSYKHLIGQKIYVVNNSDLCQLKRYVWSKNDITNRGWDVEGHYMTIVDGKRYQNNTKWKNAFDIAFQDDTDSIVYCYGKDHYGNLNNFMVILGHFEKMKQLYENKELVFVKDDNNETYYYQNGIFDLNTHERINVIKKGTSFFCTGISIDDQKGSAFDTENPYKNIVDRVVLVLHNDELGECFCYATSQDMVNGNASKEYVLGKFLYREDYNKKLKNDAIVAKQKKESDQAKAKEKEEKEQQHIQALVAKYGQSNVDFARQGRVKIGWNKELCKEAWGEPQSINKTTTAYGVHEQWVYSTSRYLYFDDGVLTAIQE